LKCCFRILTRHVLQPFGRIVFKPIKIHYYQEATNFLCEILMLRSENLVSENFSPQLGKRHNSGKVVRAFKCTGTYLLTLPLSSEDKFLPSKYFLQDSANFLAAGIHQIQSESQKPSVPPVLQSTSDLNEARPSTNNQAKPKAVKTNVLNIIIPTPERKVSKKKCRKRQERRHDTLDSY
jgi:hypothetical protein